MRGARVKVYKVLIYRYNFIFSTKEELFFCKQFQSLLSWLLSSWLIWRTGLQHSLYIIFPFCPLFRSFCPPHVPPPPSPASRPPCPQQSCPAPGPPLPCDKIWRFIIKCGWQWIIPQALDSFWGQTFYFSSSWHRLDPPDQVYSDWLEWESWKYRLQSLTKYKYWQIFCTHSTDDDPLIISSMVVSE